ncbi:MAG: glutamine amidotransferase-related protein, partial [Bacteroidota bacterium]
MQEMILILDFGSQYTQLIARRVRELNVYCEIHPFNIIPALDHVKGVILSGSPHSVRDANAPDPNLQEILRKDIPVLGVCYGAQYLAKANGGEVEASRIREYGRANLMKIDQLSNLLEGMSIGCQVWMSHGDTILRLPENYRVIASTSDVEVAGYQVGDSPVYGI